MVAPPLTAASSVLEPMEKALDSESTLSQLGFPNEFPYEFESFTSPGDSTETEDETSDDEDDFFAGLTRRLALSTQRLPSPPPFVKAAEVNSTESTRSGLGSLITSGNRSPSGPFSLAPSRPESPCLKEDSLKVISAAAGEVAKIKRENLDSKPSSHPNPNPFIPYPQNAAFGSYYWWLQQPALNAFPYPVRGVFASPTAMKQPSVGTGFFTATTAVKSASIGTGVFLPKNHGNPSDARKIGGGGCVKLQTKVVQTQHLRTETFSGRCNSRSQARLNTNSNVPNLNSETQFPKLQ